MRREWYLTLLQTVKKSAFRSFMDKMNLAEKSVQENSYYFKEVDKI